MEENRVRICGHCHEEFVIEYKEQEYCFDCVPDIHSSYEGQKTWLELKKNLEGLHEAVRDKMAESFQAHAKEQYIKQIWADVSMGLLVTIPLLFSLLGIFLCK